MTSDADLVLDVRDMQVAYRTRAGDLPAVRGVDLAVRRGETLGVAGESGCGKSTMAMAVLRLLPEHTRVSGSIRLNGDDVLSMTPGQLRAVRWSEASVIFQGAQHVLNPVREVGHQIAEAMKVHHIDAADARIESLFERVGLPSHRRSAYPHELSGGQRQRVMIAMALACDPDLLIADEPTTALDVMVQAQVLSLLGEIRRERQLSMLFITHDLSVLEFIADRVAVMYAGRIVEEGPSGAVLGAGRHPYSTALAAAFPTIGDRASRFAPSGLSGDPPNPSELPSGCAFHPRCPQRFDGCDVGDVELRNVSIGHRAACRLVEAPQ